MGWVVRRQTYLLRTSTHPRNRSRRKPSPDSELGIPRVARNDKGELLLQFDVPVRLIEEVLPDVGEVAALEAVERVPLRAHRLPFELQASLRQELVALLHVARQAG